MNGPRIFVVGVPRSGTTLFSRVLGAHPGIAISPETHYFPRHLSRRDDAELAADGEGAWRFAEQVLSDRYIQDLELTTEEIQRVKDRWAEAGGPTSHRLIFATLIEVWASRFDADLYGEKTPRHLEYVPEIKRLFPEAHVVYVVRDPRDVALSLRKVPWDAHNLVENLERWSRYEDRAHAYEERWPDAFSRVRYEDLLDQPEEVARTICQEIGVEFDPNMLAFHTDEPVSFDPGEEPWKENALGPIDPSRRQKWRDRMPADEIAITDAILGGSLERAGYELGGEPMTIGRHVRRLWLEAKAFVGSVARGRLPTRLGGGPR